MLQSMNTANDRYSGNDHYSGIKSPDRFFHYSGRCLYLDLAKAYNTAKTDGTSSFIIFDKTEINRALASLGWSRIQKKMPITDRQPHPGKKWFQMRGTGNR